MKKKTIGRLYKAVSPVIGTILVVAIIISSITAVMIWGIPYLERTKAEAQQRDVYHQLDLANEAIRDLISSGKGSSREIRLSMESGTISFENEQPSHVLMYATSSDYNFSVGGLDDLDNNFILNMEKGSADKANIYRFNPETSLPPYYSTSSEPTASYYGSFLRRVPFNLTDSNNTAYKITSGSSTPPSPTSFTSEYTSTEYQNAGYDDDESNAWHGATGTDGKFTNLMYKFKIGDYNASNLEKMELRWKGIDTLSDGGYQGFYIWNRSSSSWEQIGGNGVALRFDGLNDRINVPCKEYLKYKGGNLTICAWVYVEDGETNGKIVSKPWNGQGQYNYYLYLTGGKLALFVGNGTVSKYIVDPDPVSTKEWHYVTGVLHSDGLMELYVDGELKASDSYSITNWNPSKGDHNINLCIGSLYPYGSGWAGNEGFSFRGLLRDVCIYNDSLEQSEILQNMEGNMVTDDLLGWWKLDDAQGTVAHDVARRNDGTLMDGCKWITNRGTFALEFDGVDDYVGVPDLNLHNSNSLTIEAWVKGNSWAGQPAIVFFGDGISAGQWSIVLSVYNNKFRFGLESGTTDYNTWGNTVLDTGVWYHLVAVKNGTVVRTYINGVQDDSGTAPSTTNDVTNHRIGAMYTTNPDYYFNGTIDEVRIYNRALTADEIYQNYLGNVTTAGLVSWWKFDEGYGNVLHDSVGENHGRIHGAQWIDYKNFALKFDGERDYVLIPDSDSLDISDNITVETRVWYAGGSSKTVWAKDTDHDIGCNLYDPASDNYAPGDVVRYAVPENGTGNLMIYEFTGSMDSHYGRTGIYLRLKIGEKPPVSEDIVKLEVWDLTENCKVLEDLYKTSDFGTKDITKYWYGYQIGHHPRFFAYSGHSYRVVVYYYANVPVYIERLTFDRYHRPPVEKGSAWRLYTTGGTFQFLVWHPDGTYSYANYYGLTSYWRGWVDLTASYSSVDGFKLYVNGNEVTPSYVRFLGKSIRTTSSPVYIGSGYHKFPGMVDYVRIYNRVLTSSEVKQNYLEKVTTDGLVSWWDFNEGYGNVVHDKIGDNDGTIYGADWVYTDGGSLEFDGVDDYVSGKGTATFDDFTIIATVKQEGWHGHHEPIFAWANSTDGLYLILSKDKYLRVGVEVNDNFHHEGLYYIGDNYIGKEKMYAARWDGDTGSVKVYIDGNSVGESTSYPTGSIDLSKGVNFCIGKSTTGYWGETSARFWGKISEILVYNRALSDSEIQDIYSGSIVTSGLVAWWRFDEAKGITLNDFAGNNIGKLVNGPVWRGDIPPTNENLYVETILGNLSNYVDDSNYVKICVVGGKGESFTSPSSCTSWYYDRNKAYCTWIDAYNEDEYYVQYSTDGGATWTNDPNSPYFPGTTQSEPIYFGPEKQIKFRVKSVKDGISSGWSTSGYIYTAPGKPENVQAVSVSSDSINVTWTDNSSYESGYVIYRSTNGGNYEFLTSVPANTEYYLDTSVTAGNTYTYRVYAYKSISNPKINIYSDPGNSSLVSPTEWWDTNWQYYKVCNIDTNGYSGYYQMRIKVGYSSGGDVSCEGHCQPDFDDIRFVDTDNSTVLPHWKETYVDSQFAIFWVNVSADAMSDGKILMYYGNPSATDASDGDSTFIFFDDFTTDTTGNYNIVAGDDNKAHLVGNNFFSVQDGVRMIWKTKITNFDANQWGSYIGFYYGDVLNSPRYMNNRWWSIISSDTDAGASDSPLTLVLQAGSEKAGTVTKVKQVMQFSLNRAYYFEHCMSQTKIKTRARDANFLEITSAELTTGIADISTLNYAMIMLWHCNEDGTEWDWSWNSVEQAVRMYVKRDGWSIIDTLSDWFGIAKWVDTEPRWSGFSSEQTQPTVLCLSGDTRVEMISGEYKEIQDIGKGDILLSYDPERGEYTSCKVVSVGTSTQQVYSINDGLLYITDTHPLYARKSDGYEGWVTINPEKMKEHYGISEVRKLEIGDKLYCRYDGWDVEVTSIVPQDVREVYNLELTYPYTFFANGTLTRAMPSTHMRSSSHTMYENYVELSIYFIQNDSTPPSTTITSTDPVLVDGKTTSSTITFYWYSTDNLCPSDDLVYCWMLVGRDLDWSNWTSQTYVTYTDLVPGDYVFKVRAKDLAGNVERPSSLNTLSFTVLEASETISISASPGVPTTVTTSEPLKGFVLIDLYNGSVNLGKIWLLTPGEVEYRIPTSEGTYGVSLLDGGISMIYPDGSAIVGEPIISMGNSMIHLHFIHMFGSTFSFSGRGTCKFKFTLSQSKILQYRVPVYNLRFQFFGETSEGWTNYFKIYHSFKKMGENEVAKFNQPVNLVLGYSSIKVEESGFG